MATIFKADEREFREEPNKIDKFRLFSDVTRKEKGINPENLNFDLRQLNPGQYNAAYHFHRYAEELFMIVSGSATLRTPEGLEEVGAGDVVFFEKGETGAHQLYNHTDQPCVYLDIRTYIGHDICEYPDSDKLFIVPSYEIFDRAAKRSYFDRELEVDEKWSELRGKGK